MPAIGLAKVAERPVRRYTIGQLGAPWTPEQARREAKRILGEVAAGKDPAKQRQDTRQADKEALSVQAVAEHWFTQHVKTKRKSRTADDYRKLLDGVILPALGTKKMITLTHGDVAKLHYAHRATPQSPFEKVVIAV